MQLQLVLYILCAVVVSCVGGEAACAAGGDADDDHCTLLQGNVGVASVHKGQQEARVSDHAEEHHAKGHNIKEHRAKEHHVKSSNGAKTFSKGASAHVEEHAKGSGHSKGDAESWPDFLKAIRGVVGGAGQLERDFDAVKDAVVTFEHEVHKHKEALLQELDKSNSLAFNLGKAEHFYNNVHNDGLKVSKALRKVSHDFLDGIGNVIPYQFKSVLESMLKAANNQANLFTASFKTAADSLKKIQKIANTTIVCAQVNEGLHTVVKKASGLAKSATGLSSKGLSKDLKAARDALPEALQEEVNKVLKKANAAADRLLSMLTPAMKEITHGVTEVFADQCPNLHSSARQLETGLLLCLVLSVLSVSM